MGYYLNAWIAKAETLEKLGCDYRVLPQGFAITTQDFPIFPDDARIMHAFASYFGGNGTQEVTLWKDGTKTTLQCGEYYGYTLPSSISRALAELGVIREDSDEFDALGLGSERDNDWLRNR